MLKKINRKESRARRHFRLRKRILGTAERPRLSVFRSLRHFNAQVIDDVTGKTLLGLSTQSAELKGKAKNMSSSAGARLIGGLLASKALDKDIRQVVFDRGGLRYHGSIKAFAEAVRGGGIRF
jgi:large subunit ribosomal protein L18